MTTATLPLRTPDQPTVTVRVTEPDHLHVTVFGVDYPVPATLQPLTRSSMGRLMDHLYDVLQRAFTVEVTETDGSVQTGIIDLAAHTDVSPFNPWATGRPATAPGPEPLIDSPGQQGPLNGDLAAQTRTALTVAYQASGPAGGPRHLSDEPKRAELNCAIRADGFTAGEEVVCGFVVVTTRADDAGRAVIDVPRGVIRALPTGEVVLFGRVSGTIAMRQPDTGPTV
jgi:hypothetical protein